MKQLLASPLGSFLKAYFVAILTTITYEYQQGNICTELDCFKPMLWASVYATLPVIVNYLNPNYPGYGTNMPKNEN